MNQLSRTSILVAAARAFGAREPDPAVRNPDRMAEQLLCPEDLSLIAGHRLSDLFLLDYASGIDDPGVVGMVWMMLVRTRFIDDALRRSVENGATQVVILGAGLDTRAYRFRDLLRACRVLEADAAPTQSHKKTRLAAAAVEPPPNVSYCVVDLAAENLLAVLEAAGLSRSEKTFFLLEGVSMYLQANAVSNLLAQIAAFSETGTTLVLDYADAHTLTSSRASTQGGLDLMASWGEPWTFGVEAEDAEALFKESGFNSIRLLPINAPEPVQQYALQADGKVFGWATFRRMYEQAAVESAPEPHKTFYWLAELTRP